MVPILTPIYNLDKRIGERFFSTRTGAADTLLSQMALARARRASDVSGTYDGVFTFPDDGFVQIGKPVGGDTLQRFREKYEEFLDDDRYAVTNEYEGVVERHFIDSETFDFGEHIPETEEFMTPEVIDAIERYYGSHFQVIGIRAWRNFHHRDSWKRLGKDSPRAWHLDFTPAVLKLFVWISDVDDRHGPTHYISREETRRLMQAYSWDEITPPNGVVEDEAEVKTFTGAAGTTGIFNISTTLHRGGDPEPGTERDILTFYLLPSTEPLADDWLEPDRMKERTRYLYGVDQLRRVSSPP